MGRVDCGEIKGLELWFNSNDHLPHHFHVRRTGEWEIRVFFLSTTESTLDFEIKFGTAPSSRVQRTIREFVEANRVGLLLEWEKKVCLK